MNDNNKDGHKQGDIMLIEAAYNTPREKLPEMTNIPLDQVRPLSMMSTFIQEIKLLCDDMKDAQKVYSDIWAKHHEQTENIVGTKQTIEEEIDFKQFRRELHLRGIKKKTRVDAILALTKVWEEEGWVVEIKEGDTRNDVVFCKTKKVEVSGVASSEANNGKIDVNKHPDFKCDAKDIKILSDEWQYRYYQLRRSIGGDHKRDAVVLAQDQIAAKSTEGLSAEELADRIHQQ